MSSGRPRSPIQVDQETFEQVVAAYREELLGYCYRMLGSVQDADDAVQNALLRAWRSLDGFEGRGSVRAWLYSIATNTALEITRHRSRRELPAGFGPDAPGALGGPAGSPGGAGPAAVADPVWLEPCPDSWLAGPGGQAAEVPEARYERRESVELAFLVMLQHLPPLQRAVLILRDVLGFTAAEVSGQVGTSVAAVNSALQRARATARESLPAHRQQDTLRSLGSDGAARLARRYADALETGDADALLGMLTADATWSMPPSPTWYRGHESLRPWLLRDPLSQGWRHQPTWANGQLAVGGYLLAGDRYVPWVIDVLTLAPPGAQAEIAAVTAFIVGEGPDPAGVFATFGLPPEPPSSGAGWG